MTDAASGLLTAATLDRFSSKTRDRLLETSLVLFNERGFGAVTTASIAVRCPTEFSSKDDKSVF